jgi:cytochrome c-type biogenesis protein CcmE
MAEAAWEKPQSSAQPTGAGKNERLKFLIGGVLILAAVAFLVINGTLSGARYYITVDELVANPEYIGQTVRVAGAVDGATINFDSQNLIITFDAANVPLDYDNLATALHDALLDPTGSRLSVRVEGQPMPDLLQHEAQAIITGTMGADGIFHATELLLKCPTRFEEAQPGQSIVEPGA